MVSAELQHRVEQFLYREVRLLSELRLEEWLDGAWLEHPVIDYEISGKRDGASTRALATLEFGKSRRLHLDFEVVYNPTPALGEGRVLTPG